jgi:DNA-binding SARP family transcriptional activator/predicted Zn-dependent protease
VIETVGLIRYRMLGAIGLSDGDGSPLRDLLARPKSLALLAFLTLESREGPVTRDSLLSHFWPDASTGAARHALRQALYDIRQSLGPEVIETQGHTGVTLDRSRFTADVLELLDALEEGRAEDAAALYQGDLLPGLHFTDASPEFEAWLDGNRSWLRRQFTELAWKRSGDAASEGRRDDAIRWADRALEHDPYNEGGFQALMRLLHDGGRTAEAVHRYRQFEARLAADLDVSCSRETYRLAAELVDSTKGPRTRDPDALVAGAEARAGSPPGPEAGAGPRPEAGPAAAVPPAAAERGWREVVRRRPVLVSVVALAAGGAVTAGALAAWAQLPGSDPPGPATGDVALSMARPAIFTEDDPLAGMAVEAALGWLGSGEEAVADATYRGTLWPAGEGWGVAVAVAGTGVPGLQIAGGVPGDLISVVRFVADSLDAALGLALAERYAMLPASESVLRAHVRGEWLLARGEVHAAAAAFQRAVSMDPAFALGHHRLSLAAGMAFDAAVAERAGEVALALQAQLPEAEARIVEARLAYRAGLPDDAESLLRSVLALHPDHPEAVWDAAEVLLHFNPFRGRPVAEALPGLRRASTGVIGRAEALYHMAQIALLRGDREDFDRTSAQLLQVAPSGLRSHQVRALRARLLGTPEEWQRELAGLTGARDIVVLSAAHNLAVYAEDMEAALDVLDLLTDVDRQPGIRARAHAARAELFTAAGRPADVARELQRAVDVEPSLGASRAAHLLTVGALPPGDTALLAIARGIVDGPIYPSRTTSAWMAVERPFYPWLEARARALAHLALGDPAPARHLLRELREEASQDRAVRFLQADLVLRLNLARGRVPSDPAVLNLREMSPEEAVMSPLFSRPITRLVLGRTDRASGRIRHADAWFASLLEHSIPDLALAAVALGERARTAELRGDPAAARRFDEQLARLQAGAEPGYLEWRASQAWAPASSNSR